jgi:integrase
MAELSKTERTSKRTNESKTRPTGPENHYFKAFGLTHDGEYTLIADAWKAFEIENAHRRQESVTLNKVALNSFLSITKLHERSYMKEITRERCRAWKAFLMSAPPKPGGRKAGPASINARMAMLTQFLKFAVAQDWLERNPMEGLALNPRLVSSSRVRKSGFTDEQLARIVATLERFRESSKADHREYYWAIMALMVSGARLAEILELARKDVRQVEGVWCFLIQPGPDRLLKNKESARVVPIHSHLIKLGFLDWNATQPKAEKVFPILSDKGKELVSIFFSNPQRLEDPGHHFAFFASHAHTEISEERGPFRRCRTDFLAMPSAPAWRTVSTWGAWSLQSRSYRRRWRP